MIRNPLAQKVAVSQKSPNILLIAARSNLKSQANPAPVGSPWSTDPKPDEGDLR
ncbi:MAG: hypothetical protein LBR11_07720 [Deltaproteobacteria bacterium]|nr:hypothetical protein [Deltaproteobacteria bacterium]